ncbi:hypothetical protein C8R43DRAFT_1142243 [Mycena crocata]|nr:hypothetical protein C8R43DRAFT_1142243 [Mycena crocata]
MSDDAILNFHGLAKVLAEQDLQSVRARWMESLANIGSFPFTQLPVEIALAILKMATTKSSTYPVLMRTCRTIAGLARYECVPEVVILSNRESAISFYACISVHIGVGAGVRALWLMPALKEKQASAIGPAILNACHNVERLACYPTMLTSICAGTTFRHTALVDVTLIDSMLPWERLLGARHASALFNNIQTLRLVGGTEPAIPPFGTSFPNLRDLSLSARATSCVVTYLLDRTRFPNLAGVVVTIPYVDWRHIGMSFLMKEPELSDDRLCIVHGDKKWKELDVWKQGSVKLWNLGANEWNVQHSGSHAREWK